MSKTSEADGLGGKKLDADKAKLSLLNPAFFAMLLCKEGDGWQYTAACLLAEVGHFEKDGTFQDRLRNVIWFIRDKLGSWETMRLTCLAMEYGITKYGRNNWKKGMAWSRLLDAALRHFVAAALGEEDDPESGLPHVAHGLASLHMLQGSVDWGLGVNDLCE